MKVDLTQIRQDIDRIDRDLTTLLCERLDCSVKVAQYKHEHGLAVLNEAREREVLCGVEAASDALDPEHRGYGRANSLVYSTVMEVSRAIQHRMLGAGEELRACIDGAKRSLIPTAQARIVCQGTRGAFSHEAAEMLFEGCEPQFVERWENVIEAVKNGQADYGLIPVENSSTGSVHEAFDLIMANQCRIAAAVDVPVRQCLLTVGDADPRAVRTVVSHPQALAQCREFIREMRYEEKSFGNTATAAAYVAALGDPTVAAIASARAATECGLTVAKDTIQTFDGNTTRFVAISQDLCVTDDANRITLMFCLPHVTGSLYHTLARFALEGLNLTKLESRPLRNGTFEYAFYLDFEGNLQNENTVSLLCALSEEMPQFTLLGNYHEKSV